MLVVSLHYLAQLFPKYVSRAALATIHVDIFAYFIKALVLYFEAKKNSKIAGTKCAAQYTSHLQYSTQHVYNPLTGHVYMAN